MVVVSGRNRRVRQFFWGLAFALMVMIGPCFARDVGRELGWQPLPESQKSRPPVARAVHMATVLGLPVVIVGTLLLAGWLLGRRGVNLRMTGEGLEFPALPGMKSRRKLPWEETVAFHQLTAENLPPKGRDMMKLYDLIMGKPLALVIETACPVRDLPRSGALVRLLDQFGRTERRALIPDQMRDRAVLEFVIADNVPHDTVMDVLNRALGDRELRRRYCETAALYTIHQQAGEPVFVLLEATSE